MKNILIIACIFLVVVSSCSEGAFTINNDEIKSFTIVVPDSANSIVIFAAGELKKHIDLLLKSDIKIVSISDDDKTRKKFFIGIKPRKFNKELNPEKSVYVIRKNGIYLFGDDAVNNRYSGEKKENLKPGC